MKNLVATIQDIHCVSREIATRLPTGDLDEAKELVDKITGRTLDAKIFEEVGCLGNEVMFNQKDPIATKENGRWV